MSALEIISAILGVLGIGFGFAVIIVFIIAWKEDGR
jgi:hypothetical protein